MAAKLTPADRVRIVNIHQRSRALLRMAKRLEMERRMLPSMRALAREYRVNYSTLMKLVHRTGA